MNDEIKRMRAAALYKHVEKFIKHFNKDKTLQEYVQTLNDDKINKAIKAFMHKGQELLEVLYTHLPG